MTLDFIDLGLARQQIEYVRAWELQREIHAEIVAGNRPDAVLLLEHEAVYTAGRRTAPEELPADGSRVVEVDRGGKITWHGPGQLVAYPLVWLPESVQVVDYVRRLEEAMIRTFGELGLSTGRVDGRSGVWLAAEEGQPERKIAAIGVKVASGVSMHGLALNITNPLNVFDTIVPCGISDAGITNLVTETGEEPGLLEVADILRPHLDDLLSWYPYERSPDVGEPVPKRPDTIGPDAVTYGLSAEPPIASPDLPETSPAGAGTSVPHG